MTERLELLVSRKNKDGKKEKEIHSQRSSVSSRGTLMWCKWRLSFDMFYLWGFPGAR